MASTFEKKFKTTETTKAAGAEVVSDPIELSPRSKDHVITVTADSSCTANVNVELEMSPDGNNWCPAVSRTVSSGSAAPTGDVIGNEESVKLTPDAGEFKNKHARGGLNFDVNGAVVTPDGSGARDLMHQHIATNKSFNYSQWFKTSEAPTTTYKPVLFRHGGYDNFENAKTVELTDQDPSSTDIENLGGLDLPLGSASNFGRAHFENISLTLQDNFSYSFWLKQGSTSYNQWYNSLYLGTSDAATGPNGFYGNGIFLNFRDAYYNWVYIDGAYFRFPKTNDTNWHHYVMTWSNSGVTTTVDGTKLLANCTIYIDGVAVTGANPGGSGTAGNETAIADEFSAGNAYPGRYNPPYQLDELAIWDGTTLTASQVEELYQTGTSNAGKPNIITDISGMPSPVRYYRFEDNTDIYKDEISGSTQGSGSGTPSTIAHHTLSSSDSIYMPGVIKTTQNLCEANTLPFASIFTTTSNLSISGWFKTTDTGVLFSNTAGAGIDGLKMEVNASNMVLTLIDSSQTITAATDVNDGEWHHLVVTKPSGTTPTIKVYIDGTESVSTTVNTISNDDLKGGNGFTLIGNGQNNANATSPASTDASKLNATISNWSLHSEVLSANAVKQLYSNGHVRNIKNLPSVTVSAIEAWWKLSDATNPENDLIGTNHLQYEDGASQTLVSQQVNSDGATYVNGSINGNAFTMSLTKSFNFTTNKWVATADQETALCLSFNGFEEQAEYFALWKCSQTIAGSVIDICDGEWHNVILSYRGKNDLAGDNVDPGDTVKFGPGPANNLAFNWAISYDGEPLTAIKDGSGADYIGGLNTLVTDTYSSTTYNVGFAIQDRHLKYETSNTEEEYKPHAQFSAGIHEVTGVDNNNAFQGYVDETSFHSDTWWVDQAGTSVITNTFNQEKPATIYGSTTALTNRGASTEYPVGVPYPLLNPEKLNTSGQASDIEGSNQYINPNRYDASTNPNGGLEGWWRWGDTPGDCSITINDARDHEASINARDIDAFGIVTADRQLMTSADSIFNADATASVGTGTTITFPQVKVEGVQTAICNLANINSPLLQFVRVKWTGAGSCDLGDGKGEAKICFTNRRKRR